MTRARSLPTRQTLPSRGAALLFTLLCAITALAIAQPARAEIEVNVNRGDVQPLPIAVPAFGGGQVGGDISQVIGDVAAQIQGARTPVAQAAADRAVRAVYAAAPFRTLPREFYGERIAVKFNAREACS